MSIPRIFPAVNRLFSGLGKQQVSIASPLQRIARRIATHPVSHKTVPLLSSHSVRPIASSRGTSSSPLPFKKEILLLEQVALAKNFLSKCKKTTPNDAISSSFVQSKLVSSSEGDLIRTFIDFAHQTLLYADPKLYSLDNIAKALCAHKELTVELCKAFELKFHPGKKEYAKYCKGRDEMAKRIATLDVQSKNILTSVLHFIEYTHKTNFYCKDNSTFSFRLDPKYLDVLPYDRKKEFPELPYAIFFFRGFHSLGFNVRFKDFSRGGFRTILPNTMQTYEERNRVLSEAYQLASNQQKKNANIPEGGAKTVLLLRPLENELGLGNGIGPILNKEHQDSSQVDLIKSLLPLVNYNEKGILRDPSIIDYSGRKEENLYWGPDENISDKMLAWISNYSTQSGYKPGPAFMTGEPEMGINHKKLGVTSHGVNVYLHNTLLHQGIDPKTKSFTVKMTGGPDGDVAGNQILNFYKYYPNTAQLLTIKDGSGVIYDPQGVDLKETVDLFHKALPISHYSPEKLSEGGFLLDQSKKLLFRKKEGRLLIESPSDQERKTLYERHVHEVQADVFIPAGGPPGTLNQENWHTFLDHTGNATAKVIIEAANNYLTFEAKRLIEASGVTVLPCFTTNKGGVMSSSDEVSLKLCMSNQEFLRRKPQSIIEILERVAKTAYKEWRLLFTTQKKTRKFLTDISEKIAEEINSNKFKIAKALDHVPLTEDPEDVLNRALFLSCLPLLRNDFSIQILSMPENQKKARIAAFLASHAVYHHSPDLDSDGDHSECGMISPSRCKFDEIIRDILKGDPVEGGI